ncbi:MULTISPECIES: hypothetical protein [unclassified Streptomyces]|uniref:hypothetical protein n=1 Tax=unclassified Streptomyces TaxID=2593676 RepID=UPI0035E03411
MKKYTLLCNWTNKEISLRDSRFVIVVETENEKEIGEKAARAALEHYPDVAEHETHRTFWHGEFGATCIAEFVGDITGSLIDLTTYDVIRT